MVLPLPVPVPCEETEIHVALGEADQEHPEAVVILTVPVLILKSTDRDVGEIVNEQFAGVVMASVKTPVSLSLKDVVSMV